MFDDINRTIHPDDEMYRFMKEQGKTDDQYFVSGNNTMQILTSHLETIRPELLADKKICDYGCAHGRITRHIPKFLKPNYLIGADVWESAATFCRDHFGSTPYVLSNDNPLSDLGIKFDVIIAISVFSHLPPHRFRENLYSLSQSLSDNGIVLFTTHGENVQASHDIELKGGFFYGQLGPRPNHTDGRLSGDEYSFMCVTKGYVVEQLAQADLKLIEFCETGIGIQDLYLVEKSSE